MREILESGLVVAGTDTGVGKTVLSSLLTLVLDAEYWKPVQSGLEEETDTEAVMRMTRLAPERLHPEGYRLKLPLSPDQSSLAEGVTIESSRLVPPTCERPLIIELAGGLAVPLGSDLLQIDLLPQFNRPVVLAVRTGLGTLNHTLLSIEAIAARRIPCAGIVFIGDAHAGNQRSLERWSRVPIVGWIPHLEVIDLTALRTSYERHFTPVEQWRVCQWE